MNETDARKQVGNGSKRLAAIPVIIGILAIAAPFVFGAHALWIALGVGIGIACFAAAVVIASGEISTGRRPDELDKPVITSVQPSLLSFSTYTPPSTVKIERNSCHHSRIRLNTENEVNALSG